MVLRRHSLVVHARQLRLPVRTYVPYDELLRRRNFDCIIITSYATWHIHLGIPSPNAHACKQRRRRATVTSWLFGWAFHWYLTLFVFVFHLTKLTDQPWES